MRRTFSTYFWHRTPALTWGLIVRANRERVIPVRLTQIIGGKSWSISLMRMGDVMPIEDWRRTSPRYRYLDDADLTSRTRRAAYDPAVLDVLAERRRGEGGE